MKSGERPGRVPSGGPPPAPDGFTGTGGWKCLDDAEPEE